MLSLRSFLPGPVIEPVAGGPCLPYDIGFLLAWNIVIASNGSGWYTVDPASGNVGQLGQFPLALAATPSDVDDCCDIVHIEDVRLGRGVFALVAGRSNEVWLLDDNTLQKKRVWTVTSPELGPKVFVRQLAANFSTGLVWVVLETPLGMSQLRIYRYALPLTSAGDWAY